MKGIDVSEHNGEIDWNKAKAAGLQFAILRCGFGQDEIGQDDKQFIRNATECERLGIPYGVYLYSYALNVGAIQGEINHVLRLLNGRTLSYPVYIDMEDADNYKANHGGIPSKQTNTDMIKAFCEAMLKVGYQAGYYCNKDWYENYICPEQLTNYSFWFARPGISQPDLKCHIWQNQFGEHGGCWEGAGQCDLDIIIDGNSESIQSQPSQSTPSASTNSNFIKLWDRGSQVKNIQEKLIKLGYNLYGGADGIFGQSTYNAIKALQLAHGLGVDGIIGPQTMAALNTAITAKSVIGINTYKFLQHELNVQFGAGLDEDNISGPKTLGACPLVRYGAQGNVTKWIQTKLGISADSIFGNQTKIAVQNFQARHGLSADGIIGQDTWRKLLGL